MKAATIAASAVAAAAVLAGCGNSPAHHAPSSPAHHAARAPSLAMAATEAGCTNLLPDKNPGTAADAGCTYTATGQQAELSTFSSPRQQAAFVQSARAIGATVTAQGKGWVITGGTASTASALTCSTVVDQGGSELRGHNLTAQHVIADLKTMLLIDGIRNIEPSGTPSTDDATILDAATLDLENYSGTKLANDASQFVSDEQSYNPSGPVDGSYASAVQRDIRHLLRDCPGAMAEGIKKAG